VAANKRYSPRSEGPARRTAITALVKPLSYSERTAIRPPCRVRQARQMEQYRYVAYAFVARGRIVIDRRVKCTRITSKHLYKTWYRAADIASCIARDMQDAVHRNDKRICTHAIANPGNKTNDFDLDGVKPFFKYNISYDEFVRDRVTSYTPRHCYDAKAEGLSLYDRVRITRLILNPFSRMRERGFKPKFRFRARARACELAGRTCTVAVCPILRTNSGLQISES